jgi:hypothetical protein
VMSGLNSFPGVRCSRCLDNDFVFYCQNCDPDWKTRATNAEARVKELEAALLGLVQARESGLMVIIVEYRDEHERAAKAWKVGLLWKAAMLALGKGE